MATASGEFSQHSKPAINVGPAILYHCKELNADIQLFYGLGIGDTDDAGFAQLDLFIPVD